MFADCFEGGRFAVLSLLFCCFSAGQGPIAPGFLRVPDAAADNLL
jgi:hypothetical protein